MASEPETEAETSYREVLRVADELDIPVLVCIQFFHYGCLESLGDMYDSLSEEQEALLCDARDEMERTYSYEWRVIYMSNRLINHAFRHLEKSLPDLEGDIEYAREESVCLDDIFERVKRVVGRRIENGNPKASVVWGIFQRYLNSELPWITVFEPKKETAAELLESLHHRISALEVGQDSGSG